MQVSLSSLVNIQLSCQLLDDLTVFVTIIHEFTQLLIHLLKLLTLYKITSKKITKKINYKFTYNDTKSLQILSYTDCANN